MDDASLLHTLQCAKDVEQVAEKYQAICQEKADDNYTAIIIEIVAQRSVSFTGFASQQSLRGILFGGELIENGYLVYSLNLYKQSLKFIEFKVRSLKM